MFTASGLGPFAGQAVHFHLVHKDSAYATNRYTREVERHLTVLEKRLAVSPYLAGGSYTIADIAAWGWVEYLARTQFVLTDSDGAARWPHVLRWLKAINARPAAERARNAGKNLSFKSDFDEETVRSLFPQNFAGAL
jgi:GST-like protein